MDTNRITIANENDAWEYLKRAVSPDESWDMVDLVFENWPVLEVRLKGAKFDSTLTAKVMVGLVDLQHNLNRAYALQVYGTANANKLTKHERSEMELTFKIDEGSSLIKVNFGKSIKKLANRLVDKMEPKDLVKLIIGTALIIGGSVSFNGWMDHQAEMKQLELRKFSEENETERMGMLISVIKEDRKLAIIQEDTDLQRNELLKSFSGAESVTINDVTLQQETVKQLVTKKREKSIEKRIEGAFRIDFVDVSKLDTTMVKVKGYPTGLSFHADVSEGHLGFDQVDRLRKAIFDRTPINLVIFAKELRGEITSAKVSQVGDVVEEEKIAEQ